MQDISKERCERCGLIFENYCICPTGEDMDLDNHICVEVCGYTFNQQQSTCSSTKVCSVCQNGGVCRIEEGKETCNCSNTGYISKICKILSKSSILIKKDFYI